jgi:hypothetical protein
MPHFVAGERIESGSLVYVGDDGKIYPVKLESLKEHCEIIIASPSDLERLGISAEDLLDHCDG